MKKVLVIFDCFGVICGEIAPFIFAKYYKDPEEAKRRKNEFCHPADLGLVTEREMFENIAAAIGIDTDCRLTMEFTDFMELLKEKFNE